MLSAMLSALLFASAVALRPQPTSVEAVQPIQVLRHAAQRSADDVRVNLFAYCDTKQQPTIMLMNVGSAGVTVAWTLTAVKPGHPDDVWSNVSLVASGQFEGWMSPAAYLLLVVHYDDDGLPVTQTIQSTCSATASQVSGLEE